MTREEWDKLHPQDKKEIINILEWKKQWLVEMKRKINKNICKKELTDTE